MRVIRLSASKARRESVSTFWLIPSKFFCNSWLAAHFLGLGACYIGRAEETFATEYGQKLRREWAIPEDMVPVGFLLLGYREGPKPHAKPRKEGRIIRT